MLKSKGRGEGRSWTRGDEEMSGPRRYTAKSTTAQRLDVKASAVIVFIVALSITHSLSLFLSLVHSHA